MTHTHDHPPATGKFKIHLLVVSDRASAGQREDGCAKAMAAYLSPKGYSISQTAIVPDEAEKISAAITRWTGISGGILILTAGGTGLSPRDVTPEATAPMLERAIPGIPEAMRAASLKITPYASLTRGHAGLIGKNMVVNLPGSPKAAVECLDAVFKAIEHGMEKAMGALEDCDPPPAE